MRTKCPEYYDKWLQNYDKWAENYAKYLATNFKTTGPKGILGENQDIKTVTREPIVTDLADLAFMLIQWTVPLTVNLSMIRNQLKLDTFKREKVDAAECPPPRPVQILKAPPWRFSKYW